MTVEEMDEKRYSFREAFDALHVVLDRFYGSSFDPSIDYEDVFIKALLGKEKRDIFEFENHCGACDKFGTEACKFSHIVNERTEWKNLGCKDFMD